jgi:hypothetical protein
LCCWFARAASWARKEESIERLNKHAMTIVIWLLLLTMPYWMGALGGYTELGSGFVLGLAAMSPQLPARVHRGAFFLVTRPISALAPTVSA